MSARAAYMTLEQQSRVRDVLLRRSVPAANGKGCRFWTGAIGTHGYGAIRVGENVMTTARAAYLAFVGPLASGKLPRHTCDEKTCVNGEHLIEGTQLQNMDDWKHHRARSWKLTPEIVAGIRSRLKAGLTQHRIAEEFSVCQQTVSRIATRKYWRHI